MTIIALLITERLTERRRRGKGGGQRGVMVDGRRSGGGRQKGKLHWGKVEVGCGMEGVATSTALGTLVSLVCSLALNPIKCSVACLHVVQLISC